ncbi:HN1_G0011070.mRNA.1.CDS.1 [Saccharomyces cerevisiae]|nr:HN1_G0011070.mRNA.1.CDS.1 [Saccharomyces cerevisiae]CAI4702136.1 BAL_1a_G0044870.mRNA.1.CDS.1 [Saccharomyces cerevisiae]CAI7301952.1 BAL_1a_G0044870.mRNA.1.CDS.1 [Saccharomyces cerevisiae]
MSNTKHTTSHHMEFKRIIILTLLFILIMLIFRNSVSFKMTFQELLSRFYKKNSNSVSNNNRPSSIFSENLVDFDDVNMVDKTRLFIFLFFSFIITIPFMV